MGKKTTEEKNRVGMPQITELIQEPHHNYYAVMEFRSEQQLGLSYNYNSYVNTNNRYYRNGVKAMEDFLHAQNRNTIMATGENIQELRQDMIKQTKLFNVLQ